MRTAALALAALALAGCISPAQPVQPACDPATTTDCGWTGPGAVPMEILEFTNHTATLVSLPLVGGEAAFAYEVPEGSDWVAAVLKWRTRGTVLALTATDPAGQEQGQQRSLAGPPRGPARLDWWSQHPASGPWQFVVRGGAALQEPVFLQIHAARHHEEGMHLAEALDLAEGRFAEVNMNVRESKVVRYEWAAGEPVHFDIHTHRNGETQYLVDETAKEGRGEMTADQDDVFSLLWAFGEGLPAAGNPSSTRTVQLWYRVEGDYDLHSAVG